MGTPINRTACATRAELASIFEVKAGLKHKVFSGRESIGHSIRQQG